MAKLSSEQRKNLPEDVFGLPEDRAYPMPDESHVRSAITYFHSCPPDKKKELAANINRMAKKYGIKLSLDKHSPFRPYADKEILEEAAKIVHEFFHLNPDVARKLSSVREAAYVYGDIIGREVDWNHKWELGEDVKSAINVAIRTAAQNYLDKEYMLHGGVPKGSCVNDFVYDSDLGLCYDITRNFVYGRSMSDPEMQKKVSLVHDKEMLKSAFNSVKKTVNSPVVKKTVDDIVSKIDGNDQTSALQNLDDKLHSEDTTKMIQVGDFSEAMPSKYRNFSDAEIQRIEDNREKIYELARNAFDILILKCNYPGQSGCCDFDSVLKGMDQKGIIDGYYIRSDAPPDSYGDTDANTFPYFFKMDKSTYVPLHKWQSPDQPICIVTALKIFDDDNHPQYFYAILDEFLRRKKLPKMPIRRITIKGNYSEPIPMTEAVKFFNIKAPDKVLLDKLGDAAKKLMKDKNERVQKLGKMVLHLVEDLGKGIKNKGERIAKCIAGLVVALSVLTFVLAIVAGVVVLIVGIVLGLLLLLPGIALAALIDPSTRKRLKMVETKCKDKAKAREIKKITDKL